MTVATHRRLSERELQVLLTYVRTGTYKAVAEELGISQPTVRNHLTMARLKLGAANTLQAYAILKEGDGWQ